MIGAIGSRDIDDVIVFEVSEKRMLTFDSFKRSNNISLAKNNVLLRKPVSEYVGQELDTISFTAYFKSELGTDPRAEVNKLIYLNRDGSVVTLMLWGQAFGTYRWVITGLDMNWTRINKIGYCRAIECGITLEEYAGRWD